MINHVENDLNLTFHAIGLGGADQNFEFKGKSYKGLTLQSIMRELGHEGRVIDVLKIDIEGAEWAVLSTMF